MQTQIFTVHKRHLGLRAPTVLALGFALTILVGALVLMLPVSAAGIFASGKNFDFFEKKA